MSGLLNANRDYLWSSIAPVANNVIVIATFILYAVVAPQNQEMALYIIAIGNPLGVFVQLAIQLPALKKNGIRIRPRVDFRDPALRETLGLGIPALFVMLCSTIVVSVQTAAAYGFSDNGPSCCTRANGSRSLTRFSRCPSPPPCSPNLPTCRPKATPKE